MRLAALVIAFSGLAACGDNITNRFTLDAAYDDHDHSRFFGIVQGYTLAPALKITPVDGAQICIDDACTTSAMGGEFVLVGTGPGHEATLTITAPAFQGTIVPVIGGAAGDRNLGGIPIISPAVTAQSATGFQLDPMIDSRGTVLLSVARYDSGKIQLAMDGLPTSYLDAKGQPGPTLTQVSDGNSVVWFAVAPGDAVVHTTTGFCEAASSGWPGEVANDLRLPTVAGQITFLAPFCHAL